MEKRLLQLYRLLPTAGKGIIDVGTDHGYVPLALLESGISEKVIMSDISAGSLLKCKENAEALLPDAAPFDLRQGSGIEVLESGEVDTVIMAGMGGMLIQIPHPLPLHFRGGILQWKDELKPSLLIVAMFVKGWNIYSRHMGKALEHILPGETPGLGITEDFHEPWKDDFPLAYNEGIHKKRKGLRVEGGAGAACTRDSP